MKTNLIVIGFSLLFLSFSSQSQVAVSISPGLGFNSANIGYKVNKLVPFIGFQYFHAGLTYESTGKEFNYDFYQVMDFKHTGEYSLSVYVPAIGLKYLMIEKEKLKAYTTLTVNKPFVTGKAKNDNKVDEYLTDYVKGLRAIGGEFGLGCEYFFDEHFSVGGEFGLRYFRLTQNREPDYTFFNPLTGFEEDAQINESFKANISPTYTKIALNFYF